MIEWRELSRSIRHETAEVACDIWPVFEFYDKGDGFRQMQRGYRFTVFDKHNRVYVGQGIRPTQDLACESAMKKAEL